MPMQGAAALKPLEIFARNLLAGWTSFGNQPLLFQATNHFRKKKEPASEQNNGGSVPEQ